MKDSDNYYLLLEPAYGAPLHVLLRAEISFSVNLMRFVGAQVHLYKNNSYNFKNFTF